MIWFMKLVHLADCVSTRRGFTVSKVKEAKVDVIVKVVLWTCQAAKVTNLYSVPSSLVSSNLRGAGSL